MDDPGQGGLPHQVPLRGVRGGGGDRLWVRSWGGDLGDQAHSGEAHSGEAHGGYGSLGEGLIGVEAHVRRGSCKKVLM